MQVKKKKRQKVTTLMNICDKTEGAFPFKNTVYREALIRVEVNQKK